MDSLPQSHLGRPRFPFCHFAFSGPGVTGNSQFGNPWSRARRWNLSAYGLDWAPKNWCFRTVVLEKTLQSPLHSKEIKPVNPKGNQPRIFIGRTDAEAEAPILQPPDVKSQFTGKDPDAGKNWRQNKKGSDRGWDGITDSMDTSWSKLREIVKDRETRRAAVHGVTKSQIWLSSWTTTTTALDKWNMGPSQSVHNFLKFYRNMDAENCLW